MSTDEPKLPLVEPSPLYPTYSHSYNVNGQYQMQTVNGGQGATPPLKPNEEEGQGRGESEDAKLEDGDDLLPGTGPAGIPDKHFNVSSSS